MYRLLVHGLSSLKYETVDGEKRDADYLGVKGVYIPQASRSFSLASHLAIPFSEARFTHFIELEAFTAW
jgi:hypothetical protein